MQAYTITKRLLASKSVRLAVNRAKKDARNAHMLVG